LNCDFIAVGFFRIAVSRKSYVFDGRNRGDNIEFVLRRLPLQDIALSKLEVGMAKAVLSEVQSFDLISKTCKMDREQIFDAAEIEDRFRIRI
jgi:hypothetical protein